MLETFAVLFLVDGAMHIAWDIICDRNTTLRKITRRETINDSTNELISQLQAMNALNEDSSLKKGVLQDDKS